MGKKSIIKSLVNSITLISYHKILYEKGLKPEAKKHLEDEIRDYSTDGFELAQTQKFSSEELAEIREKCIVRVRNILNNKYPDVDCSAQDIKEQVIDTMQEMMLQQN